VWVLFWGQFIVKFCESTNWENFKFNLIFSNVNITNFVIWGGLLFGQIFIIETLKFFLNNPPFYGFIASCELFELCWVEPLHDKLAFHFRFNFFQI
jgi:hypothetical protein